MWKKKKSELKPVAFIVRQVMSELSAQKNSIILYDSWYVSWTVR